MRFTLDANILVYATDGSALTRRASAIQILDRAVVGDCVLTPQSLAEYFHVVSRKRIVPQAAAASQVRRWMDLFSLSRGADASALRVALRAVETRRFQFYDALLLATAQQAGCTAAISEDMADGAELNGLRVVAAFSPDGGISAGAEALLPPAASG